MSKILKRTILEMSAGIILYEVLLSVVLVIFSDRLGYSKESLIAGVAVGTVLCFAILIDMSLTAEDVIASGSENYARNKTILHMFIRKLIMIAAAVIFWRSAYVNVAAMVFALLGLKPGAYMQPLISGILNKKDITTRSKSVV